MHLAIGSMLGSLVFERVSAAGGGAADWVDESANDWVDESANPWMQA